MEHVASLFFAWTVNLGRHLLRSLHSLHSLQPRKHSLHKLVRGMQCNESWGHGSDISGFSAAKHLELCEPIYLVKIALLARANALVVKNGHRYTVKRNGSPSRAQAVRR